MHRYTVEILYHFECELCHNWWSYAITPTGLDDKMSLRLEDEKVHCMHCGHTKETKAKPNVHVSTRKTQQIPISVENNSRMKVAEIIDKEIRNAIKIRK